MPTSSPLLNTLLTLSITLTLAHAHPQAASVSTVPAISQIPDGQIQGPTGTASVSYPMTSHPIYVPSSVSYENPFTIYTTQTDSRGVITGMPSVVTSIPTQPALVTSQPVSPTLPHYSGFDYGTSSSESSSAATTLSTSVVAGSSGSGSASAGMSGTSTRSAVVQQSTGGAAENRVATAAGALVVLGCVFSLL